MKELKEQIRNCDLTQFNNYDAYIKYVQKLVVDYLKAHHDLSDDDLFDLLEEVL